MIVTPDRLLFLVEQDWISKNFSLKAFHIHTLARCSTGMSGNIPHT